MYWITSHSPSVSSKSSSSAVSLYLWWVMMSM